MILNEVRKRETIEWLERNSNHPRYCIHFNDINKLGINPSYRWRTPLGVSTFPLKETWKEYEGDILAYPWGSRRKYIIVVDYAPNARILKVEEISRNDVEKLSKFLIEKKLATEDLIEFAKETAKTRDYYWEYWNILRQSASFIAEKKGTKSSIVWNVLLRKFLGYDIVSDRKGLGVIHINERFQVLFLHQKAWVHVKTLYNPFF